MERMWLLEGGPDVVFLRLMSLAAVVGCGILTVLGFTVL